MLRLPLRCFASQLRRPVACVPSTRRVTTRIPPPIPSPPDDAHRLHQIVSTSWENGLTYTHDEEPHELGYSTQLVTATGYIPLSLGTIWALDDDVLDEQGRRYELEIVRKLGWGSTSSSWLAASRPVTANDGVMYVPLSQLCAGLDAEKVFLSVTNLRSMLL
jgi:hypothetical protein